MKKQWWKSKIVWTDAIGMAAVVIQLQTGFIVPPEYQAMALAAVNFVLRLITKSELTT